MKTKCICLTLFLIAIISSVSAQYKTLHLNFQGIKYKSVRATIIYIGQNTPYKTDAISVGDQKWDIQIPDSIFYRYTEFRLGAIAAEDESIKPNIALCVINAKDTLKTMGVLDLPDKKEFYINTIFEKRSNGDVRYPYASDHHIIMEADPETILSIESFCHGFSMFYDRKNKSCDYEQFVEQYIELIKKNPDSNCLIKSVSETSANYCIDDLKRVFNTFSPQNRKSFFGQRIEKYIAKELSLNKFDNIKLPLASTLIEEPIIKDSTKYNLIVFSASWCGPCHKQIPLLKEVYNDLMGNLDIVYVSIDESKTVDRWKNLLKEEDIPWRSVLAFNDVDGIIKKYNAYSIPKTYLVYPNKKMEIIDIRIKKEKDKLYRLVQAPN